MNGIISICREKRKLFFQRAEAAQLSSTWEIWFGVFSAEVWILILLSFLLATVFLWLVVR
jgi:hypothetical protein